ncbi:MAG: FAD-binding protein [Candidatus Dependentiae bacterium]
MSLKNILLTLIIFSFFSNNCAPHVHCDSDIQKINDYSRLNQTKIDQLVMPESYAELQTIIQYAQAHNLKVSIAGSRHSQGGHAFFTQAIVIDSQIQL